jgi:hypothetical protein
MECGRAHLSLCFANAEKPVRKRYGEWGHGWLKSLLAATPLSCHDEILEAYMRVQPSVENLASDKITSKSKGL